MAQFMEYLPHDTQQSVALAEGLRQRPAQIAPRYLYDALGARLFVALTELPEYYLARCERAILHEHGAAIADSVGKDCTLVDLGAGDGAKAESLLPLLAPRAYLAVDVCRPALRHTAARIERRFPQLQVSALATDFFEGLHWPVALGGGRPLFFYPGSSIGNFSLPQARAFLHSLCQICRRAPQGGDLLIGVDLLKPRARLEAAYDDALGLTACFNLNLLRNVNKVLGADFDVRGFRHVAHFDAGASRIEMLLVSRRLQEVRWRGGEREFEEGESIVTEHSYKYRPQDFAALLEQAGFETVRRWHDPRHWFMVCHARSRPH